MGWRCRRGGRGRRRSWPALRGFRGRIFRGSIRLCGGFGVGHSLQMTLHLLGDIGGNGTRMRLLLGNAKTWQKVNDSFRLDLELAR
jgi:hypothetical protein